MSAVPRSTGPRPRGPRELQCVLVGANGIAEPSLGDPDVGQRDRAAEHVGEVPDAAQTLDGGGVAAVRGLEVAAPPRGEPGQGRGGRQGEVVALGEPARWPGRRARRSPPGRRGPGRGRLGTSRSRPAAAASSPSSTTTILADGSSWAASSSRSTSSSRLSTSSNSPLDISAPTNPTASTGRSRTTSSGMSSSQRRTVASAGPGAAPGWRARRGRRRARRHRRRGRAGPPGPCSPAAAYHWPARRCRSATSPGRSSSRWVRRTSANRWW